MAKTPEAPPRSISPEESQIEIIPDLDDTEELEVTPEATQSPPVSPKLNNQPPKTQAAAPAVSAQPSPQEEDIQEIEVDIESDDDDFNSDIENDVASSTHSLEDADLEDLLSPASEENLASSTAVKINPTSPPKTAIQTGSAPSETPKSPFLEDIAKNLTATGDIAPPKPKGPAQNQPAETFMVPQKDLEVAAEELPLDDDDDNLEIGSDDDDGLNLADLDSLDDE
jgi:hypothetical protein